MRGLLITLLMFSSAAFAADFASVTGTYSSLVYHEDSGDLMGIELKIVYSFEGHFITVQCGAGVPITVPLEVTDSEFAFELSEKSEDDIALCGLGRFHGRVDDSGLYFSKDGRETETFVPKQESYWEERSRIIKDDES